MTRRYGWDLADAHLYPWRVGGKVPRNVYAVIADHPLGAGVDQADVPIGSFDTDMLAARAVEDHNRSLEGGDADG